jgi:hypothetical protein
MWHAGGPSRNECPAWMLTVSIVALVPLHFSDSLQLAVLMLQTATLNVLMTLRVRSLAEAIGVAVDELWRAELDLALLVRP